MTPRCVLRTLTSVDSQGNQRVSTFTPPIFIDMGDEGSTNLERHVKAKTGETVKADEDWTKLSGTRSIDISVVAGFMFQSDAGSACSIQVTENGNIPVHILIDREHEFGMFLVVTQRQEQWKTSGKFCLRFVRRTPVLDKRCTARMANGPVPSPSGSSLDSTEERPVSADEGDEEQEVVDRVTGASSSLAAQTPSHTLFEDAYSVPLAARTESFESNGETTDEEDHQAIGAAALRGTGGGIVPPGMSPHTQ